MTSPLGRLAESARAYVRTRGLLVGALLILTLAVRCVSMPRPPERNVEAIAAVLGQAVGGTVKPDDFVWEGRGGVLHDALVGRRVLFLAARPAGANATPTNDLFRAEVRLTRAGRPIALRRIVNLTNTPRGHEHDLVAFGQHAAYATMVGSAVETITVLELGGDMAAWHARTRAERFASYVENWISTGSRQGIGRIETSFGTPPQTARFELTPELLVMALGETAQAAAVSLSDASVNPGPRDEHAVVAQRLPHPVTPRARVVEQALRATLGPDRAQDFRRLHARVHDAWIRLRESSAPPPAALPAATGGDAAAVEGEFPPPKLALSAQRVLPGEGVGARFAGCAPRRYSPKHRPRFSERAFARIEASTCRRAPRCDGWTAHRAASRCRNGVAAVGDGPSWRRTHCCSGCIRGRRRVCERRPRWLVARWCRHGSTSDRFSASICADARRGSIWSPSHRAVAARRRPARDHPFGMANPAHRS
ncbi:MAG: hypothetical protein IPM54_44705 [Polyangiaceae bacterium]|nr:hypothetical protein [Polyangiaceae bacterium]